MGKRGKQNCIAIILTSVLSCVVDVFYYIKGSQEYTRLPVIWDVCFR